MPSDAELVRAVLEERSGAFETLYRRHVGSLWPLLWRLAGGDTARAEDWLQETFVLAWHKLGQLRDGQALASWLKRMALNLALADKRRLNPVEHGVELPDIGDVEPPWPAADADLEKAIARLPERARQVLVLFHIEGAGHQEIAALMNIEVGTSKAQLHRARSLLKEMLS